MKIPVIGDLFDCPWLSHKSTIKEILITFFFSFMPLWLGSIFIYLKGQGVGGVYKSFEPNIINGELLIYCNTIVAPIFYMTLEEGDGIKSFPSKIFHLLIFCVVMVLSAAFYALQRADTQFNNPDVIFFSYIILAASIFILYSSSVINRWRRAPAQMMTDQTASFVNGYKMWRTKK